MNLNQKILLIFLRNLNNHFKITNGDPWSVGKMYHPRWGLGAIFDKGYTFSDFFHLLLCNPTFRRRKFCGGRRPGKL